MISAFLMQKGKPFVAAASRAEMLQAVSAKDSLLWVDLEDPNDFESECLVEIFNFHPLAVEDCMTDHSEPKVDDYDEYLFLVMHSVGMRPTDDKTKEELCATELNVFFGKNYVVTFHRRPVRAVGQVREVVRKKPDYYMSYGADFLVHAVLDHLVDNYQPLLDQFDRNIDKLEDEIFNTPPADYLATVMQLKNDVFNLKRIVAPQRDTVNFLTRNPTPFIRSKQRMYFRDIYDHLSRIYGTAERFHENLSSIMQVYFSYSSHKLNEVVKHMTVLATVTMPAVVVASIYGMNFHNMPELDWKYGYPMALGVTVFISAGLIIWMKIKKWL